MEKTVVCRECGRKFKSQQSKTQHHRDVHQKLAHIPGVGKEGARAVLDDIGDDLPDGAYFALAEDLGLDIEYL